jgi:hypothetical protein
MTFAPGDRIAWLRRLVTLAPGDRIAWLRRLVTLAPGDRMHLIGIWHFNHLR